MFFTVSSDKVFYPKIGDAKFKSQQLWRRDLATNPCYSSNKLRNSSWYFLYFFFKFVLPFKYVQIEK